jgi:hypothetical protein
MTPAGAIELPLLVGQVVVSIAAAWAGMRIVDDIKHLVAARAKRATERS